LPVADDFRVLYPTTEMHKASPSAYKPQNESLLIFTVENMKASRKKRSLSCIQS